MSVTVHPPTSRCVSHVGRELPHETPQIHEPDTRPPIGPEVRHVSGEALPFENKGTSRHIGHLNSVFSSIQWE